MAAVDLDAIEDRLWRNCGHRADYASAAEHERDCPAHGLDARDELPDRQLLAAVHRWARTNGWHATWIGWANAPWAGNATMVIEWDDDELTVRRRPAAEIGQQWPIFPGRGELWPVTSVRVAVDILAALGVLPVELSSAWRAGRAAR